MVLAFTEPPKVQTIKEIQENIVFLEQEKKNLEFQWSSFRIGNGTLKDFIRTDLEQNEKSTLESLVLSYIEKTRKIQENIKTDSDSQKELLLKKQDFYVSLVSYIEIERLANFKNFVAADLLLYEKTKDVSLEIEQKNIEKQERVITYEAQAQENGERIRTQVQEKIYSQVQGKLNIFVQQEKFQTLANESKISIFQNFSDKLSQKSQEIKNTQNPTRIIEDKVYLYEVVQNILESYISQWQ